jgi:RNA polymerase sigma factor (sigma-70 family)
MEVEMIGIAVPIGGNSSRRPRRHGPTTADDHRPVVTRPRHRHADRSTSELVEGCRTGDRDSWMSLVARYETLVYSVARRNGLGADDAADVTQTTFATLLKEIDNLRDVERLPTWLATVARRQAWRVMRRAEREPVVEFDDQAGPDPYVDWERFDVVNQAMNRLGEPCRRLITLMFFDPTQPSNAEVADRLGRALGGIGPMRGRCLEKLRAFLEDDGGPW